MPDSLPVEARFDYRTIADLRAEAVKGSIANAVLQNLLASGVTASEVGFKLEGSFTLKFDPEIIDSSTPGRIERPL